MNRPNDEPEILRLEDLEKESTIMGRTPLRKRPGTRKKTWVDHDMGADPGRLRPWDGGREPRQLRHEKVYRIDLLTGSGLDEC